LVFFVDLILDYIQTRKRLAEAPVRYSTQIKPISYVKAHAAELLERIAAEREPIIITQNGEAKAVLVDVHSYEEMQEQIVLLQRLALADSEIEAGQTVSMEEMMEEFGVEAVKA